MNSASDLRSARNAFDRYKTLSQCTKRVLATVELVKVPVRKVLDALGSQTAQKARFSLLPNRYGAYAGRACLEKFLIRCGSLP